MELTTTKTQLKVVGAVLLLAGLAWGVKHFCFPPVDEKLFQLDYNRLRAAPHGIFIFRPTRYAKSNRTGAIAALSETNSGALHLLGRSVTANEVIAMAFRCKRSRIVLPKDAPTNRYDFLVTVAEPLDRLQKAVTNKLGLTAKWQEQETDVLELRVHIPNARAIQPSGANESTEWQYVGNVLHWRHAQVTWLVDRIEELFGTPVLDKTGMTGFYNFAFAWDWRGRRTDADRAALSTSLGELGLKLEPDTAPLPMLVVERKK